MDLAALTQAVQANCHIADARHATELSLCNYLLQMREFFRWERGLPFGAVLPRAEVGAWLAEREALWEAVQAQDFQPLPPGGLPAFAPAGLHTELAAAGLAYGAGLAGRGRPSFFLAELLEDRPPDAWGLQVRICGRELARGLHAPPATLQGQQVVLRQDALARWLWQLVEAQGVRQAPGPMQVVVQAYGWQQDFNAGLPQALHELGEVLLLHEQGEHLAGQALGNGWAALRLAQPDRRTGLALQAVRDLLADFSHTLPTLLARGVTTEIHFWFAGLDGLREQMCPALKPAYQAWCAHPAGTALPTLAKRGAAHFGALAEQALRCRGPQAVQALLAGPQATLGP